MINVLSVGDRVRVLGFGSGTIIRVLPRLHESGSSSEYYWVQLRSVLAPQLFSPAEITTLYNFRERNLQGTPGGFRC